jgi:hypothetical protein
VLRYLAPTRARGVSRSITRSTTTGAPALDDPRPCTSRCCPTTPTAPAAGDAGGSCAERQSTLVEFDGFGMDPDGDVVSLDRIVSQPAERLGDGRRPTASRSCTRACRVSGPGVVPLPRRRRVRQSRARASCASACSTASPIPARHLHRLRAGAGGCHELDPRESARQRRRPDDGHTVGDGRAARRAGEPERRQRQSRIRQARRTAGSVGETRPS